MKIRKMARMIHTMNQLYCQQIGDFSQPDWADAEDWQKQSSMDAIKFQLDNPHAPPSAGHEKWMEEKQRDGWTYGTVKDIPAKKHPCMVSFFQLPREQQLKDTMIKLLVMTLNPVP